MTDVMHREVFLSRPRWPDMGDPSRSARPEPASTGVAGEGESRGELDQISHGFRAHLEEVRDELELMRAELAGTRRTLTALDAAMPVPVAYQRWELGLQRLEVAYRAAAERLSGTAGWAQIATVWENVQQLMWDVIEDIVRVGAPVVRGLEDRFRAVTVAAATAIGDVSLQVAARLERDGRSAPVEKIQAVGAGPVDPAAVPAQALDQISPRNRMQANGNPWFGASESGSVGWARIAEGGQLPVRATRGLGNGATLPVRSAPPPPAVAASPPARPRGR
jgi:hypothetical protein